MTRYFLPFFILLLMTTLAAGQTVRPQCGTDILLEKQLREDPDYARWMENFSRDYVRQVEDGPQTSRIQSCAVRFIPVVVHVVYNDAATNISDAQIESQITALNRDFRKIPGTVGSGNGVDSRIQFCLAAKDPAGNPTNGITRTQSALTVHTTGQETQLKNLIRWNTQNYLNMWIVKSIDGGSILGYSSFPGFSSNRDGVVLQYTNFGTTGTVGFQYQAGRTATHEVGHYLGLYHTFQSGCSGTSQTNCLTGGDRVCDTPAESTARYGCPNNEPNTCIDNPIDYPDPIRNYMNYVDDDCMDQFTEGQLVRVDFVLNTTRSGLISPANLLAAGCESEPPLVLKPEADFTASNTSLCPGGTVQFEDLSRGCVENRAWLFPGGTPFSSTDPTQLVSYGAPGQYPVQLIVSNSASADTFFRVAYVEVASAGGMIPFSEGFELTSFPPAGWRVKNLEGVRSWERTNSVGSGSPASIRMRNFSIPFGLETDYLLSPLINRGSGAAWLSFDYAYAAASTASVDADLLAVDVSVNCGEDYIATVFERAGTFLSTVSGLQPTTEFVPQPTDWKTEYIDLTNISPSSGSVRLRFRFEGKGGQTLYLDNINISTATGIDDAFQGGDFRVSPNPFSGGFSIFFSSNQPENVQISLLDLNGKEVWGQEERYSASGIHVKEEDPGLSGLAAGLYLLKVSAEGKTAFKKLVKQ